MNGKVKVFSTVGSLFVVVFCVNNQNKHKLNLVIK